MTDDESLKAFEQTISSPPFELELDRYPNDPTKHAWPGAYQDYRVHLAHDIWQAAVKFATNRERERCQEIAFHVMCTTKSGAASIILDHIISGQEPKP